MTHVVLSVYFSGTGNKIRAVNTTYGYLYTLPGFLYVYTEESKMDAMDEETIYLKRGFDGCAVTDGIGGIIFGSGLEKQCNEIKEVVLSELQKKNRVTLNCFGYSRGAIPVLLLVKMLGDKLRKRLQINIAMFDPVPGNLINTASIDLAKRTLTNQVIDLGECKNLQRVLALYSQDSYLSSFFLAPIFPKYPQVQIEQDIVPGHHGHQFLYVKNEYLKFNRHECFLTYFRIQQFLAECGTQFDISKMLVIAEKSKTHLRDQTVIDQNDAPLVLPAIYQSLFTAYQATKTQTKSCHAHEPVQIKTDFKGAKYFNLHHKQICHPDSLVSNTDDCALIVTPIERSESVVGFIGYHSRKMLDTSVGGLLGGVIGGILGLLFSPFSLGTSVIIGAAFGASIGLACGTFRDKLAHQRQYNDRMSRLNIPSQSGQEDAKEKVDKPPSQRKNKQYEVKTITSDWRKRLNTPNNRNSYFERNTFFAPEYGGTDAGRDFSATRPGLRMK